MSASDELFYTAITLFGVTLMFLVYWLLLRKLRAAPAAVEPRGVDGLRTAAQPKQDEAVPAPAVAELGTASQPEEKPPAVQPAASKTMASRALSPGRRIARAARRASVALSRLVKKETTVVLQALSAGAEAQVPRDASLRSELTGPGSRKVEAKSTKATTTSKTKDDTRDTKPQETRSLQSHTVSDGQMFLPASSKEDGTTTEEPVQIKREDARNVDLTNAQPPSESKVDATELSKNLTQPSNDGVGSTRDVVAAATVSGATVANEQPVPQQENITSMCSAAATSAPQQQAKDQSVPTSPEQTSSMSKRRRKKTKKRRGSSSAGIDQSPNQSEIKSDISSKRKRKSNRSSSRGSPSQPSEAAAGSGLLLPKGRTSPGAGLSNPRLLRRRSSTRSRASRKSLIPEGSWSEDVSPPAGWAIGPYKGTMFSNVRVSSRKQSSAAASLPVKPPLITLSPMVPNMDIFSQEHSPYVASPSSSVAPVENRGIVPYQPATPMKGSMDIFSQEHSPYVLTSPPSGLAVDHHGNVPDLPPTPMKGNMDFFSQGNSPSLPSSPPSGLAVDYRAPYQPPTPMKGNVDIFSRGYSPNLPSSPPSGLPVDYRAPYQPPTPMKGNMDLFSRGHSPYLPSSPPSGLVEGHNSGLNQPPMTTKDNVDILQRVSLEMPSSSSSGLAERYSFLDQSPTPTMSNMSIFSRGYSPYTPTSPPSSLSSQTRGGVPDQPQAPASADMNMMSQEHSSNMPLSKPSGPSVPDQPLTTLAAKTNTSREHVPAASSGLYQK